ncbi:hypothetical protein [Pseudomonas sp. S2_E01]
MNCLPRHHSLVTPQRPDPGLFHRPQLVDTMAQRQQLLEDGCKV